MNNNYLILSLISLLLICFTPIVNAQQVIFPTGDTYVEVKKPNTNYGNATVLKLRKPSSSATDRYLYFSFDLATLEEMQGQVIFELHRTKNIANDDIRLEAFSDIDFKFDENTATWNNQPTKLRSFVYGRQTGNVLQFDITDWANYVIAAGETLQLKVYTDTFHDLEKFASKEHADASKHPRLTCYNIPNLSLPLVNMPNAINTDLVTLRNDGQLEYTADTRGNTLIDHGMVGYHQGLRPIPNVPIVRTLTPTTGDRTADIQAAIDAVEAMPLNQNGHRGAILLKAGTYTLEGILSIEASGVVIKGEGNDTNGTTLRHIGTDQVNVLNIGTTASVQAIETSKKNIVDAYVPTGTKTITVEANHSFQVGDKILVTRAPTQAWIDLLGMGNLAQECGDGHSDWTPGSYTISTKHNILSISGNTLYMDTPIVDPIDFPVYASGYVQKYNWIGLEECGVENIRFESKANFPNDENHARRAIETQHLRNSWFRKVNAKDFINNCVKVDNSYQITVDECEMEDYKSKITGGRRYGFALNKSQLILVKNCKTRNGRHDYALGSRTAGPNVFFNCFATNAFSDIGPHHRWSTGCLWEDIVTDNKINLQLRKCSGSGHGWASSQNVLWNCEAGVDMAVHNPPADHQNWAIGCTGTITNQGYSTAPLGYVESSNNPIDFSLYIRQAMNFQKRTLGTGSISCNDINNDFETSLGIWNDGGGDCQRGSFSSFSNSGTYAIRLRDDSGKASSIFSNTLDLSNATHVNIEFSYMAHSMDWKEDFLLEISTNGGTSFTTFKSWTLNDDFVNNTRYNEAISIPSQYFSATTVFRIRCDASADYDFVYLDDLKIEICSTNNVEFRLDNEAEATELLPPPINIYPNPIENNLNLDLSNYLNEKIYYLVSNMQGQIVTQGTCEADHQNSIVLDLNHLPNGNYIMYVKSENHKKVAKHFVVLR